MKLGNWCIGAPSKRGQGHFHFANLIVHILIWLILIAVNQIKQEGIKCNLYIKSPHRVGLGPATSGLMYWLSTNSAI